MMPPSRGSMATTAPATRRPISFDRTRSSVRNARAVPPRPPAPPPQPAHELPLRVDNDSLAARNAAQRVVVVRLEPVLADDVVGRVALVAQLFVLVFGDLADIAEDVRGERLVGIVADRVRLDVDTGEIALFLRQPRDLRRREVAREDHG